MTSMNKTIFTILLLILPVFIVGCGQKSSKTLIKFMSWGSKSETAIIKPLLKEFETQNPDIKVEFVHVPANYFQKLHLSVASGLTPDVVAVNNLSGPLYAENNVFMDLTNFLEKDKELSREDFFKQSLNAFTYKGMLYAIPRDISNLVIYYNKKVFDKYGVSYPKEKQTFDDFLQTCRKLTKDLNNDGKIDLFGVGFEENPLFWLPFLWSNSGGIISEDLKEIIIDNPESIEALQFYADLRNKYHVAPTKSEKGSATTAQLFMQERTAMHISGRWSVPGYRKNISFDWDIARFPYGKAGSKVDCDASGLAVSKSSEHPDEALRLVKFLSGKKASERFAENGLIVPARKDVANSDVFLNKNLKPKSSRIFIDIIPDSVPTPVPENYGEITDILKIELESLWNGKKSATEVIDKDLVNKLQEKL